MGYSMNDLNNAADNIHNALEERSQRKGEELADKIIHGNFIGLIFARWFNFLTIYIVIMLILTRVFDITEGMSFLSAFVLAIFVLKTKTFWYMGFWKAIGIFTSLFVIASVLDTL